MLKKILFFALFASGLLLQNYSSVTSKNLQSKIEIETTPQPTAILPEQENKIQLSPTGKAEFNGVSFNYNPQIFEIRSESIIYESPMQDATEKPGENFPNHTAFTLQVKNKLIEPEVTIKIIPIAHYRRMYAVSASMMEAFDEDIDNLWKVLKDKEFRDRKHLAKGEIPFIPYYDAEQSFSAKVNHLPTQSGKGIVFLTQYMMEPTIINNQESVYFYEGITDDGKYYILGTFPVSAAFLPDTSDVNEFEGYNLYKDEGMKQYDNYISKVTKRLENLPADKYEPNLKYIEEIISSIKVEK